MKKMEDYVRTIPDFPEPGIMFRDVTSVLQDPDGLKLSIHELMHLLENTEFDVIAGTESRGFLFGMPLAYNKRKGFVPIRKKGKLPRETVSQEYDLEYGTATIEMHKDAIFPGQRVVLVDDLLATGGTAVAACNLVKKAGGEVVAAAFIIELDPLKGREKIEANGVKVVSMLHYDLD